MDLRERDCGEAGRSGLGWQKQGDVTDKDSQRGPASGSQKQGAVGLPGGFLHMHESQGTK